MPSQDFGSKIGTSSSPVINKAIETGKCVQMPQTSVASALANMATHSDVKVPK